MIVQNLSAVFDLIRGREEGLGKLDTSADGFWRSFIGLALAGIVDLVALLASHNLRLKIDPTIIAGVMSSSIVAVFVALISYLGSMLALYLMCRSNETKRRFPLAVIANNWAAPLISLGFLPVTVITLSMRAAALPEQPGFLAVLLLISALVVVIIIGIRLIRISLAVPQGQAVALFLGSASVSWVLQTWLSGLFGF